MMIDRARAALVAGSALALLLAGCAGTTEPAGTEGVDDASQSVSTSMPTATVSSATPSQTPEPAASACQDAITVSLDAEIGSGRGGYLVLTNAGTESCALVGYLEPAAIDSSGVPVTTVDHSDLNGIEEVPVELEPGASGYSSVFWDDSPDTLASCDERVDAEALEVTVPGASAAQRIETGPLPLCNGRGSILHLGPIDREQRIASKGY